jgi:chemotaxis protein MotA
VVDKSTFLGILIAFGGILAGLLMEGGRVSQILQPTAAIIVFSGTFGAVMVQFPMASILKAIKSLRLVIGEPKYDLEALISELVGLANKARRNGIISLDSELNTINNMFMRRSLMLAVDGTEPQELRKIMEVEMEAKADDEETIPRVYESAGGFAPTIGIIGAILGLIQVMQHLEDIGEVGKGIAVAFVATIYGLASANVLFLPSAGKLRTRFHVNQLMREMTLQGVISILEGMNPRMLENKLRGFLADEQKSSPSE